MRKLGKIYTTTRTIEGAGVSLRRGFSPQDSAIFDPFLLFDDFSNTEVGAYEAGFPTHPHRGIETVTYILKGTVEHCDSIGNKGKIGDGDVQWMTAGSGIMHEEMPIETEEGIQGFQLWVNLPRVHKMTGPRYQEIRKADIPCIQEGEKDVCVIAGSYQGTSGPVRDLLVPVTYLSVTVPPYTLFSLPTLRDDTYFIYVLEGRVSVRDDRTELWIGAGEIGLLTNDFDMACSGGKDGAQFLVIGGTPLREPVVSHGPIVMNTEEEIKTAMEDLKNGVFINS